MAKMARLSGDVTSRERSVFRQFDPDKPALIERKLLCSSADVCFGSVGNGVAESELDEGREGSGHIVAIWCFEFQLQ